ncbi:MAG: Uma2 family endonuclease, partial [Bernardetiaceae bacterium]|nr:Uma2 family endonuclease [Bernardetiaceae bacterium]
MTLPAALAQKKQWTYSQLLEVLDEDISCELIDSQIYLMPSPSFEHQKIVREIVRLMLNSMQLKGEVIFAPFDVVLSESKVVQPDIFYITVEKTSQIEKKCFRGAPDLVVEVVSDTSLQRDYFTKRELYERFGVTEYWIVDPAHKSVTLLELKEGKYELKAALSAQDP